jgi:hypothetical protein
LLQAGDSPRFLRLRVVHPDASEHSQVGNQAGRKTREKIMNRLLTIAELQHRSQSELRALFRQASQALARTATGTPERFAGLATLENVSRAMTMGSPGF